MRVRSSEAERIYAGHAQSICLGKRFQRNGDAKFQGSKEHVCWWDSDESREILDTIKPLENVRGVKRVVSFHVNYEGEFV